jgi:hypothetical protein
MATVFVVLLASCATNGSSTVANEGSQAAAAQRQSIAGDSGWVYRYPYDRRFDGIWQSATYPSLVFEFYADTYRILEENEVAVQGVFFIRNNRNADEIFLFLRTGAHGGNGTIVNYALTADSITFSNAENTWMNGQWKKVAVQRPVAGNQLIGTWKGITETDEVRVLFYQFYGDGTGAAYSCEPEVPYMGSISEITYDIGTSKLSETIIIRDVDYGATIGPFERDFQITGDELRIGNIVLKRI